MKFINTDQLTVKMVLFLFFGVPMMPAPNPSLTQQPQLLFGFDTATTSALSGTAAAGSSISLLSADSMSPSLSGLADYADTGTNSTRMQMVQTGNSQDLRAVWAENADPAIGLPAGGIDLSGSDIFSVLFSLPKQDNRLAGYGVEDYTSGQNIRFRLFLSNNANAASAVQNTTPDFDFVKSRHNVATLKRSDFSTNAGFDWNQPIRYIQFRATGGTVGTDSYDPDFVLKGLYSQHDGLPVVSVGADDGHITNLVLATAAELRNIRISFSIIPTSLEPTGNNSTTYPTGSTGGADRINWDNVRAFQAAGHEINLHPNIDAEADFPGWLALVQQSIVMFAENGIDWKGIVWHQGRYGNDAIAWCEANGIEYARATSQTLNGVQGFPLAEQSRFTMRSATVGFGAIVDGLSGLQALYDELQIVRGHLSIHFHIVLPSGSDNSLEIDEADMNAMLDFLAADRDAGRVAVETLNQASILQGFGTQIVIPGSGGDFIPANWNDDALTKAHPTNQVTQWR